MAYNFQYVKGIAQPRPRPPLLPDTHRLKCVQKQVRKTGKKRV